MSNNETDRAFANDDIDDIEITLSGAALPATTASTVPVQIRLETSVRQQINEYARTNTSCELGGVLIGDVETGNPATATVEGMIPARFTEAVKASITFTHDTWRDIHAVKDRLFPDKKIIGWFHTHPGFGIFLSNYDLHIHRHFFNLDWQIAYVIDPLAREEGFFRWEMGEVRKAAAYEEYGETPLTLPPIRAVLPPPTPRTQPTLDWRYIVIAVLICANIGQAIYFRTHERVVYVPEHQIVVTPPPEEEPTEIVPAQPSTVKIHIVQATENLWTISRQYYPKDQIVEGIELLKKANNLNSDLLQVGMQLKVPSLVEEEMTTP